MNQYTQGEVRVKIDLCYMLLRHAKGYFKIRTAAYLAGLERIEMDKWGPDVVRENNELSEYVDLLNATYDCSAIESGSYPIDLWHERKRITDLLNARMTSCL